MDLMPIRAAAPQAPQAARAAAAIRKDAIVQLEAVTAGGLHLQELAAFVNRLQPRFEQCKAMLGFTREEAQVVAVELYGSRAPTDVFGLILAGRTAGAALVRAVHDSPVSPWSIPACAWGPEGTALLAARSGGRRPRVADAPARGAGRRAGASRWLTPSPPGRRAWGASGSTPRPGNCASTRCPPGPGRRGPSPRRGSSICGGTRAAPARSGRRRWMRRGRRRARGFSSSRCNGTPASGAPRPSPSELRSLAIFASP